MVGLSHETCCGVGPLGLMMTYDVNILKVFGLLVPVAFTLESPHTPAEKTPPSDND